ncbi:MAG: DUF5688 family protein [Lachnospiraceae bacterium]|nr:DUF5688 family protein [Lachnospiraceae bacterium]
MEFSEFKEKFTSDIAERLYDIGIEAKVSNHDVSKLNESYESVTVTPEGSNVGVNLNINRIYDAIENGETYEGALKRAVETIERGIEETPAVDVTALTDYSQMKERLVMEVVSVEVNKEMLKDIPHKEMEDMAVVYRFDLGGDKDNRATVLVTNQLMNSMGITADQLHNDAMENAPNIRPAVIRGMTEVIAEMSGMTPEDLVEMGMALGGGEEMMYVASSADNISGAGVIAYEDFMNQAAERVGGDFFILPSSRHEVLLVPDDGTKSLKELEAMVKDVNATQVSPEDKLTDSVYHYDSKNKIFELGEKFVSRMQDKESVLDSIKEKKKEIAAKEPKKDEVAKTAAKTKGGESL